MAPQNPVQRNEIVGRETRPAEKYVIVMVLLFACCGVMKMKIFSNVHEFHVTEIKNDKTSVKAARDKPTVKLAMTQVVTRNYFSFTMEL